MANGYTVGHFCEHENTFSFSNAYGFHHNFCHEFHLLLELTFGSDQFMVRIIISTLPAGKSLSSGLYVVQNLSYPVLYLGNRSKPYKKQQFTRSEGKMKVYVMIVFIIFTIFIQLANANFLQHFLICTTDQIAICVS